jgi:hypothetical protein
MYVIILTHNSFKRRITLNNWHYFLQWMCIPFAMYNEHVGSLSPEVVDWIGSVDPSEYFYYLDYGLLLIFGGIPWQVSQNIQ